MRYWVVCKDPFERQDSKAFFLGEFENDDAAEEARKQFFPHPVAGSIAAPPILTKEIPVRSG